MEKVNLKENSEVEIESKNGTIVIFPATKKYSLDDLIDQITKSNLHSEEAFKSEGDQNCEERGLRVQGFQEIDVGANQRDYTLTFQDNR
jgi:antitoxin component of MazEF toxin-antitoxin module